jgi:isocitrate dehydrogenase kinase/phosphatase
MVIQTYGKLRNARYLDGFSFVVILVQAVIFSEGASPIGSIVHFDKRVRNGWKGSSMAETSFLWHPHDHQVDHALDLLWGAYRDYCDAFEAITGRAAERFEQCDWLGMHRDTVERLELYPHVVGRTYRRIADDLGLQAQNPKLWRMMKSRFAHGLADRPDAELACTFYNSIHRRILQTIGIEPELEFVAPKPFSRAPADHDTLVFDFEVDHVSDRLIKKILTRYRFRTPFADMDIDARLCAERMRLLLDRSGGRMPLRIEMLKAPFFRDMGAFLIGRMQWRDQARPLVLALGNGAGGLFVDALLLRVEEIRILFSFSHTYFHVRTDSPHKLVRFLKELMPSKRTAELYISLGYNKHGKTELYSDLLEHQRVCSQERFEMAAGQRGMVMIAFNMPGDNLIYKLIRDRFAAPKHATRQQVMEKYEYVFKHDRAGRLVDVQTFENLEIENCCFTPELLAEIRTEARRTASIEGEWVILNHVYVERRLIPLDIFLKTADAAGAKAAVIDYGRAIKDLAQINVFPGDMLIKNFGVTQLGRVVFYDYDELCPLTDCNFRHLPQARRHEEEMASEPWYLVAENDVFPEEFASFLALPPDLRSIFMKYHGDLLTPEYWQGIQEQIRTGIMRPIPPYSEAQRLRPYQVPERC